MQVNKQKKNKIRKNKKKAKQQKKQHTGFYLFLGILFTGMPFVYYRSGLDPAIHPRLLFTCLVLIAGLIVFFWFKRKQPLNTSVLRNPAFYFMAGYFVITALSPLFAINPREGFYDIIKSFVFLLLSGLSAVLLSNTPDWQKRLPVFFLIPAVYLLGVGISEYFEYVLFAETGRDPENLPWIYQVRGAMAHKNQFSIALMLMLPFLGYGAYKPGKVPRFMYIVLIMAILFAIFILETRSVWVGIGLSGMLVFGFLIFYGSRFGIPQKTRLITGISVIVFLMGAGSFIYFTETEDKDSVIHKIKNITNPSEENNIHRYKIWQLTMKMIGKKPVTGVGAGNWKIASRHHFSNYDFRKQELNWLRPHNDYLWVFSEKGIFGFIAFLGIFAWTLFTLHRMLARSHNRDEIVFLLLILSGLAGYLTVSLFTFPLERMNQQVYVALMIASVAAINQRNYPLSKRQAPTKALTLVAFPILIFGVVYSISVMTMESRVKEARHYHRTQQWEKLLEISKTIPQSLKTLDAEAMPIAWYGGLANSKLGNIEASNKAYQKAYEAHPTHVQVLNNLGRTYFQLGEYEKAKDSFEAALKILPDYFESLVNITSSYMKLDNYEQAHHYINKIKPWDLNDQLKRMKRTINREFRKSGERGADTN